MSRRFDVPYWRKEINEALQLVRMEYPAGCLAWLKVTNPERIKELKATVEAARAAFLEEDRGRLARALQMYLREHFQVFETFRRSTAKGEPSDG
ncbi:hypothetical protein GMST_32770 [Geomonas silvestris]|uniref:GntR C-terminal domain-containing protein n=1 Tax=Geomonas silvestris TaxID=2740184 RepID=A0A6V8MLW4_9BACT|nr:hypothetical protein [Geomonas silvestris]GFO60952.1 hypothetical protein GMST_32770 [Geomonas silvestris]